MQGLFNFWNGVSPLHQKIIFSLCALLTFLILHKLWSALSSRLLKAAKESKSLWDEVLITALAYPVTATIWFSGLTSIFYVVGLFLSQLENQFVWQLVQGGYLAIAGWFILRLIKQTELAARSKPAQFPIDLNAIDLIVKVLYGLVILSFALMILQTIGVQITGLLAVGGAGSLVVGLAAKDLLSNLFGGAIVYLDRPFKVGDWILSPDKEIEGTVEKISWRMTRIRTFNKQLLYVPNSVFTTISIQNPSRMSNRRIKETIGLRYQDIDKMPVVLSDIDAMLRNHPEIDTNQTLMVMMNSYGAYSVDFFIYTFTKTTEWIKFHSVKQDVLLKVADIVHSHNADFAFPTSTVHLPDTVRFNHIPQENN